MSDCKRCGLRLETAAGQMSPFCANDECSLFDKVAMKRAKRLVH